jgi:NADH-quinone oxidoreductase subunit E
MTRKFSEAALQEIRDEILPGYPNNQSALLAALWVAEREFGTIDLEAVRAVADALELPPAHVYGVYTFYTLFRKEGQGKFVLDVCMTLPCALRGAGDILRYIEKTLGIKPGETTEDGMFTLRKVECLADCHHAPVVQCGNTFYRELTEEKVDGMLAELRKAAADGKHSTCAIGDPTTSG